MDEHKKDIPKTTHLIMNYRKCFCGLAGWSRVSQGDKESLFWFLTSVAGVISGGKAATIGGGKKKQSLTYRDRVTTSDEAFAFMVIEYHKEKWKNKDKEEKKRLTGKDKGDAIAFYKSTTKALKKYREDCGDKFYPAGEEWYEKKRKEARGDSGDATISGGGKDDEQDDSDDEGSEVELEMNPFNPFSHDIREQEQV